MPALARSRSFDSQRRPRPRPTPDDSDAPALPLRRSGEYNSYDSLDAVSTNSHDPLLPITTILPPIGQMRNRLQNNSTSNNNNYQPPLLTLNTLDPIQRANLVRQSRKLNKVLGETPHIAEHASSSSNNNNATAGTRKLQRRGTIGPSTPDAQTLGFKAPPLSRGRVSKSLIVSSPRPANAQVPVLRLASATLQQQPQESTPMYTRPRRLSDSSLASTATGVSFSFAPVTHQPPSPPPQPLNPRDSVVTISTFSSTQSIISDVISPDSSKAANLQRAQTRARLAKLQRVMGEDIPSELVLEPQIRRRRLSMDLPPEAPSARQQLKHKRSRSLWKRELKADLAESAPESPIHQSFSSSGAPPGMRRSKSKGRGEGGWRRFPNMHDSDDEERQFVVDVLKLPLTEKQKALNVRRALKMVQVFGVPPPQSLFEVQNQQQQQQQPSTPYRQNSATASISRASLASLAYMLDHDRDSLYDLLSATPDSPEQDDEEDGSGETTLWPYERRATATSIQSPTSTTNESPILSITTNQPPSRSKSTAQKNMISPLATSGAPNSDFRLRRLRANKLSKFFGVGYQDLFNTMLFDIPATPDATSAGFTLGEGEGDAKVLPSSSSTAPPPTKPGTSNVNGVLPPPRTSSAAKDKTNATAVKVQLGSDREIDLRSSLNWGAAFGSGTLSPIQNTNVEAAANSTGLSPGGTIVGDRTVDEFGALDTTKTSADDSTPPLRRSGSLARRGSVGRKSTEKDKEREREKDLQDMMSKLRALRA